MKSYTFAEVVSSYEQKRDWERQFPVSRFVFRPLSFPLAYLALRLTGSAEAVAWTGLGVGAAASWLFLNLAWTGLWPGICGLFLFALLDAVDGNMARTTGKVTLYGKMLDGTLGKLAEGAYMPALACGLFLAGEAPLVAPAAGFTALCAMLYASGVEASFDFFSAQKASRPAARPEAKIGTSRYSRNPFYLLFINLNAFNVQVLALIAVAAAGGSWPARFVYCLAAYYLLRLAVVFIYYMRRARRELN